MHKKLLPVLGATLYKSHSLNLLEDCVCALHLVSHGLMFVPILRMSVSCREKKHVGSNVRVQHMNRETYFFSDTRSAQ